MLNKLIAKIVALLPENLVWIFSKRYIAGKYLSDAVKVIATLNKSGISSTIDVLGEYIEKTFEAVEYKQEYLVAIDEIVKEKLETTISVKPSMFGLLLDEEFCYQQLREVIAKAKVSGLSVCMDMEDSSCTQTELNLFEKLYNEFPGTITLVLQAYLKRTLDDLKWLKSIMKPAYPINIRICKGIYVESPDIAFQTYKDINANYMVCAEYLIENGFFAALATHDKKLIKSLESYIKRHSVQADKYEFQMLFGVRPKLRNSLIAKGHSMRVYVPFGTSWYGYSTRRLKENPRMIPHIIKALVFQG